MKKLLYYWPWYPIIGIIIMIVLITMVRLDVGESYAGKFIMNHSECIQSIDDDKFSLYQALWTFALIIVLIFYFSI